MGALSGYLDICAGCTPKVAPVNSLVQPGRVHQVARGVTNFLESEILSKFLCYVKTTPTDGRDYVSALSHSCCYAKSSSILNCELFATLDCSDNFF